MTPKQQIERIAAIVGMNVTAIPKKQPKGADKNEKNMERKLQKAI